MEDTAMMPSSSAPDSPPLQAILLKKRPRSPSMGWAPGMTPLSDPELEPHPQRRHLSEFMSHNLSSHMSLGHPGEGQPTPNHPSSSGGAALKSPSPCSTPPPLPRSSLTGLPYWMPAGAGASSSYHNHHGLMSGDAGAQAAGVSPFGGTSTLNTVPTVPALSVASPPPPQPRVPSLPCLLGSHAGQPGGGAAHSSGSTLPREASGEPLAGDLVSAMSDSLGGPSTSSPGRTLPSSELFPAFSSEEVGQQLQPLPQQLQASHLHQGLSRVQGGVPTVGNTRGVTLSSLGSSSAGNQQPLEAQSQQQSASIRGTGKRQHEGAGHVAGEEAEDDDDAHGRQSDGRVAGLQRQRVEAMSPPPIPSSQRLQQHSLVQEDAPGSSGALGARVDSQEGAGVRGGSSNIGAGTAASSSLATAGLLWPPQASTTITAASSGPGPKAMSLEVPSVGAIVVPGISTGSGAGAAAGGPAAAAYAGGTVSMAPPLSRRISGGVFATGGLGSREGESAGLPLGKPPWFRGGPLQQQGGGPAHLQAMEMMPPSPSDARFTFADLRKTALMRSFNKRSEDAPHIPLSPSQPNLSTFHGHSSVSITPGMRSVGSGSLHDLPGGGIGMEGVSGSGDCSVAAAVAAALGFPAGSSGNAVRTSRASSGGGDAALTPPVGPRISRPGFASHGGGLDHVTGHGSSMAIDSDTAGASAHASSVQAGLLLPGGGEITHGDDQHSMMVSSPPPVSHAHHMSGVHRDLLVTPQSRGHTGSRPAGLPPLPPDHSPSPMSSLSHHGLHGGSPMMSPPHYSSHHHHPYYHHHSSGGGYGRPRGVSPGATQRSDSCMETLGGSMDTGGSSGSSSDESDSEVEQARRAAPVQLSSAAIVPIHSMVSQTTGGGAGVLPGHGGAPDPGMSQQGAGLGHPMPIAGAARGGGGTPLLSSPAAAVGPTGVVGPMPQPLAMRRQSSSNSTGVGQSGASGGINGGAHHTQTDARRQPPLLLELGVGTRHATLGSAFAEAGTAAAAAGQAPLSAPGYSPAQGTAGKHEERGISGIADAAGVSAAMAHHHHHHHHGLPAPRLAPIPEGTLHQRRQQQQQTQHAQH